MATSFSGGRSRREPPTMGKQLINLITCSCESSAPFFVIYKTRREPTRIGDRLVCVAHGRWFSPTSSTTKAGRHDIAEILLKVALSTNNYKNPSYNIEIFTIGELTLCHIFATYMCFILLNCNIKVIIYQWCKYWFHTRISKAFKQSTLLVVAP
jgi:hypothetical protein